MMAHSQSDTVHVFDTWVKGTKGLLRVHPHPLDLARRMGARDWLRPRLSEDLTFFISALASALTF